MPLKSIVDDYLLAAMLRAKAARAENGTVVLTVPDFPGTVACGADARQAFDELYRRLEAWIRVSLERGHHLPTMVTENVVINLNTDDGRGLAMYHENTSTPPSENNPIYVGSPDEFESFLDQVRGAD